MNNKYIIYILFFLTIFSNNLLSQSFGNINELKKASWLGAGRIVNVVNVNNSRISHSTYIIENGVADDVTKIAINNTTLIARKINTLTFYILAKIFSHLQRRRKNKI